MLPVTLSGVEFAAFCAFLAALTAIIGYLITWGVNKLSVHLEDLSKSIGSLREELHALAMRVLKLEEWRRYVGGRRHDDAPEDPS